MTYEELRHIVARDKDEHHRKQMQVHDYGRFSVMVSDRTGGILVDPDIAEKVSMRRWCLDSSGYAICNFGRCNVRLHDFVMAMNHIEKPSGCFVDHINQDRLDNRLQNLRFATPAENSANVGRKANNKSGYTGVCKTRYGTFRAYITVKKQRVDLGQYKTLDEAVAVRREAEERLGFLTRSGTVADRLSIIE